MASYHNKKLLIDLREGDENSFTQLYYLYEGNLYRYVLSIVKSPSLADDVLQEVFIKIWEQRNLLDPEKSFLTFLFTVARNHVLNLLKRASLDENLRSEIFLHAEKESISVESSIDLSETETIIQQAIDKLPSQQKKIFELCKMQGLTYEETAGQLGITPGTVNVQMVKSLKTVKEYLIKHDVLTASFLFFLFLK